MLNLRTAPGKFKWDSAALSHFSFIIGAITKEGAKT